MCKETDIVPYRKDSLRKSNFLIEAKYKASLMEQKIEYISLLKVQNGQYEERRDGLYVDMPASEIRKHIGGKSSSIYSSLKEIADGLLRGIIFGYEDGGGCFKRMSLINYAEYKNGVFTLRFPLELKECLVDIKKNFTNLPQGIVMSFKKTYSFPLYQLLKSQCYYPSAYQGARDNIFSIRIRISELKMSLGVVDAGKSSVIHALNAKRNREDRFDLAVEADNTAMFKDWNDFNRRCLKPSVGEINRYSDIHVQYKKKREGKGGRVRSIEFIVWLDGAKGEHGAACLPPAEGVAGQAPEKEPGDLPGEAPGSGMGCGAPEGYGKGQEALGGMAQAMFWGQVKLLFQDAGLDMDSIRAISEAAGYDIEKVKSARAVFETASAPVRNTAGWIISAIRDGYSAPIPQQGRRADHGFMERAYDMDAMERVLLEKTF